MFMFKSSTRCVSAIDACFDGWFQDYFEKSRFRDVLENFDVFGADQKIENRDEELKEKDFPNPLMHIYIILM